MSTDQNIDMMRSLKIDLPPQRNSRNTAKELKESIKMSLAGVDETNLISESISPPRKTSGKTLVDYMSFESDNKENIETVEKLKKKKDKDIFRINAKDCIGSKKFSIKNASPCSDYTEKENLKKKNFNIFESGEDIPQETPRDAKES
jgi:hypothetical protein